MGPFSVNFGPSCYDLLAINENTQIQSTLNDFLSLAMSHLLTKHAKHDETEDDGELQQRHNCQNTASLLNNHFYELRISPGKTQQEFCSNFQKYFPLVFSGFSSAMSMIYLLCGKYFCKVLRHDNYASKYVPVVHYLSEDSS